MATLRAHGRVRADLAGRRVDRAVGHRGAEEGILPEVCSGEGLGCFGLTEPGTGSDAASVATRARRAQRRLVDLGLEDVHLAGQPREGAP